MTARLCLTLDDRFVDHWLAAAPLLAEYGARVTFCVHALHQASPQEKAGLHRLRDDGHEIACHSRTHARIVPYLKQKGLTAYLQDEVDPALKDHREAGFGAQSWASPFHACPPRLRRALAQRVRVIRARGPAGEDWSDAQLRARIVLRPGPLNDVDALGSFDTRLKARHNWDHTARLLDLMAVTDGHAVFCGHDIRPPGSETDAPGYYATLADLDQLLGMAQDRGITSGTLSGIAAPE